MKFPFEKFVNDENETKRIAESFAEKLNEGDIVLLIGNLGSGKTFFTKAVCGFYNIENVSSPSFAIVNEYEGKKQVDHFDFYRIKKIEELYDIGFDEYVNDDSKIIMIEWADLFPEILPDHHYKVTLENLGDSKRKIKIDKND